MVLCELDIIASSQDGYSLDLSVCHGLRNLVHIDVLSGKTHDGRLFAYSGCLWIPHREP